MRVSFLLRQDAIVLSAVLAAVMVGCAWWGHGIGRLRKGKTTKGEERSLGTMESSLLALFGLLLAFSFSMAGGRFEARRDLVIHEANAIGTAVLRADLYPEEERKGFREDFQRYLETRIEYHEAGANLERMQSTLARGDAIQHSLWERATRLSRNPTNYVASVQMVPALNEMFDAASSRLAAFRTKVPESVVWLLFLLAAASSFMVGYGAGLAAKFDWLGAIGFAVLSCAVIYVTLDLDRERRGFIRLETSHQSIDDLRGMFSLGKGE